MAGRVQVTDFRDGGHLAQESEGIEASLVDRHATSPPRRLGDPASLSLDLPDELLDPSGGGDGFLELDADERRFVLLVGEVDVDETARDERSAHQDREEDHVLQKEASAGRHWIIRSVRHRTDCGTARPMAFAALRLTTSSKRVGRSTGRSAAGRS